MQRQKPHSVLRNHSKSAVAVVDDKVRAEAVPAVAAVGVGV